MNDRPLLLPAMLAAAVLTLSGCGENNDTPPASEHSSPEHNAAAPAPQPDLPPLPIEETGRVETLPPSYPPDWVLVDEASFFSMFGGKVIVLDIAESDPAKRMKGLVDKNLLGNFTQAKTRPELYVIETFHERGSRGKRTDVLTIYDKTTLSPVKEIIWPTERLTALPERYAMALSADERFLYVANFTPAASFTVVDLDTREIVDTIGTPGCVLTYPTGTRSVSSLCSDGGMLTTVLDENGHLRARHRLEPFFDTDQSPIFERPAIIDGIAYFPSFVGVVHAIDMRGEAAKYIEHWSLVSDAERQANWRPSGLVLNDHDDNGLFYIIMQPDGHEGSQTHGGTEVWVFDMAAKQRQRIIKLPRGGLSVAVTRGDQPKLVVTNGELSLDIFNAANGQFMQTVTDFGNMTPLLVNKSY